MPNVGDVYIYNEEGRNDTVRVTKYTVDPHRRPMLTYTFLDREGKIAQSIGITSSASDFLSSSKGRRKFVFSHAGQIPHSATQMTRDDARIKRDDAPNLGSIYVYNRDKRGHTFEVTNRTVNPDGRPMVTYKVLDEGGRFTPGTEVSDTVANFLSKFEDQRNRKCSCVGRESSHDVKTTSGEHADRKYSGTSRGISKDKNSHDTDTDSDTHDSDYDYDSDLDSESSDYSQSHSPPDDKKTSTPQNDKKTSIPQNDKKTITPRDDKETLTSRDDKDHREKADLVVFHMRKFTLGHNSSGEHDMDRHERIGYGCTNSQTTPIVYNLITIIK
jgi:hypothetical protein